MSVDPADFYNNGMSWDEFVASATHNIDRMKMFYDEFEFDEDTAVFFASRSPLQVLVIGEDWCPDVVQNAAMVAKIGEEVPGMEVSIVGRDDNPELMDLYEAGGKRRIPVIAFFDMTFRELARWTGRSKAADEWVFGEVLKDRSLGDMSEDELRAFNDEFDRRFKDTYARESLQEWMHLMEDEDF
jgi:hypothetical protein